MKMPNFGMILHLVKSDAKIIGREDAETVLNDGILYRMKIKIEFLPFPA